VSRAETLARNLIVAAVVVVLFLFVNPLAGLIGALVGGTVAIRMANAQRR
jgi:preprotein translocase subunit SecE